MAKSDLVQSLLRGMDLLRLVSARPQGMSLNELSAASGLQKTTAYNLLRTLCARNFLVKDQQNRFQLGPAIFELAESGHSSGLQSRLEEAFHTIHEKFPLDVLTVSALHSGMARCILRFSPDRPGELQHPANMSFPPYISVTALALQAANPEKAENIERQFPFEEYGEGMWGNRGNFNRAKSDALKLGYCMRQRENHFSLACILPDGYTLGFSCGEIPEEEVLKRYNAARVFKLQVWGENAK